MAALKYESVKGPRILLASHAGPAGSQQVPSSRFRVLMDDAEIWPKALCRRERI